MTCLRQAAKDYLTLRRSLGYKLIRTEKLLEQFLNYLEAAHAETITVGDALAWAELPSRSAAWSTLRLSAVRGFAKYVRTIDPSTQVPPADILPWKRCRAVPYLYSDDEIRALTGAAAQCLRGAFRIATYQTFIGLLAVTGMRVGEAIRLDRADIDLDGGVVIVRFTKFGKTRGLPLHPTTVAALGAYLSQRDAQEPRLRTPAAFVSNAGTRLLYPQVHVTFHRLLRKAGLVPRSASCRPRVHDFRHSFAVNTLLDAYRNGWNVQERVGLLSTYLGHVDPTRTYWYLSAAPELLTLAAERLVPQWRQG